MTICELPCWLLADVVEAGDVVIAVVPIDVELPVVTPCCMVVEIDVAAVDVVVCVLVPVPPPLWTVVEVEIVLLVDVEVEFEPFGYR